MATSLTMAARRAAAFTRIPSSTTASLVQRRGLAGAADHHGPPKVNCWKEPMNPGQWKEEHLRFEAYTSGCSTHFIDKKFVIASLSGWGLLFFGAYKIFSGGKNKEENLVQASQ